MDRRSTFAARTTDPSTSKKSAKELQESGMQSRNESLAAGMVVMWPGLTAREIGQMHGVQLDYDQFHKRARDCERHGTLLYGPKRRCTVTGKTALTCWPPGVPMIPDNVPQIVQQRIAEQKLGKKKR